MRAVIADLCALLKEQKSILENLLSLSEEERNVIVGNEPDKLEAIVRRELKELSKLGAIEKRRMALHKTISLEFGLQENNLNVSSIAAKAGPGERVAIKALQHDLTDLITRHAEINAENRELINAHIEYSDIMLNLMVDSEDPLNNFYGGDGKALEERKKSTGFFDGHA